MNELPEIKFRGAHNVSLRVARLSVKRPLHNSTLRGNLRLQFNENRHAAESSSRRSLLWQRFTLPHYTPVNELIIQRDSRQNLTIVTLMAYSCLFECTRINSRNILQM